MKFYGEDQFSEQNSQQGYNNGYNQNPQQQGYNNGYNQNPQQQGYNNGYYQNPQQQGYNNGYYQNPQQQGYNNGYYQNPQQPNYNNGYHQNPMMDGEFHRPDFSNQPYNKKDFLYNEMKKQREEAQKNANSSSEKLKGILFLVWFIGSIIAILISATARSVGATLISFGQIFAIVGTIAFVKEKDKLGNILLLLFPLVGFGLVFGGMVAAFGTEVFIGKLTALLPYIIMVLLFIVGTAFLIISPIAEKKKRARCTAPVKAVVIDLIQSTRSGHRNTYTPLYEYYYNGKTYRQKDDIYTNVNLPNIGQEMEAYVNPDDPEDILVVWKGKNSIGILLGIAFVAFSIILFGLFMFS